MPSDSAESKGRTAEQKFEKTKNPGIVKNTNTIGDRVKVSYVARTRGPDGRTRSKSFAREADAKKYRSIVLADQARGEWSDPRLEKVTFSEWAGGPQWSKHVATLRVKTRSIYVAAIREAVEVIGHVALGHLDRHHIEGLRDHLLERHNPGGTNQILRVVRTCLEHAVDARLLVANAAAKVRATDDTRPDDRAERRALTAEEAARLLAACPDRWQALVASALTLGLRFSELAGLERRDVDVDANTIRVDRQKYYTSNPRTLVTSAPKTATSVRSMTMPSGLVELYRRHLDEYAGVGDEGIVFPSVTGRVMDQTTFRARHWLPMLERAGLRHEVFHGLRVSAITLMLENGTDAKTVSVIAGHSNPSTTLNVYARSSPAAHKANAERVGLVLDGLLAAAANVVPLRPIKTRARKVSRDIRDIQPDDAAIP